MIKDDIMNLIDITMTASDEVTMYGSDDVTMSDDAIMNGNEVIMTGIMS